MQMTELFEVCKQETRHLIEKILDLSIAKGSASVLADYLFATADWREKELEQRLNRICHSRRNL